MKKTILLVLVLALSLVTQVAEADFIWTQKADMPITKLLHSTCAVGGKIYSIGGYHLIGEWNPQWEDLKRVDEYDPATDTWTRKADIPTARGYTSTCVLNDKIYVMGGDAESSPISIVEVYDPATNTWAEQTELPTKRWSFTTSVVDGIIYVFGGNTNPGNVRFVEAYDPTTDTWTRKADMPMARSDASSCAVDGKIYVIGGWTGGPRAEVQAYDPQTDTWAVKAPMPIARYYLGTSVVGGKIYAIGGWGHSINGPTYSTVEVYDPQTDTWAKGVDIPITTAALSTSVVDGKIYVFGGSMSTHAGNHWVLTSAVYASDVIVDLNGDGIVDAKDMCILVDQWGTDNKLCDIGPTPFGDGIVDVQDLMVLAEHLFEDYRLVAHWKFDETEGNIAYDSVGEKDATLHGDPVWHPINGRVDGALEFDGNNDYVSTPFILDPAKGSLSAFAWIKGGAPGQVIISQTGEFGGTWLGTNPSSKLMTGFSDIYFGALVSESVVTDIQWHHVGFVYDMDTFHRRLYVDGAQVAEDATAVSGMPSDGGLYIGASKDLDAETFFSGMIDDVRIYNQALTTEEIAALAQ